MDLWLQNNITYISNNHMNFKRLDAMGSQSGDDLIVLWGFPWLSMVSYSSTIILS